MKGNPVDTIWDDIKPVQAQSKERVGYPTQKPLDLLERIIQASSNSGDMVLDPFCGCATACCFWQLHLAHFGGLFWPPCKRASKSLIPGHLLSFLGTWSGAEPEGRSAGRCPQKRAPSLLPPSLLLRQRPTKAVGLLARLDDVSAVGNAIQQRLT